jgi:membrane-bound lytic murein transglycosylase D
MTSKIIRASLGVGVLLLLGCTTLSKSGKGADAQGGDGESGPLVQISGHEEASTEVSANLGKPYVSPLGEIPLDITPLTEQWIKYFQGRGRKYMEVYLERSTRYLPMMKNTLRENGLPEDLVYVALIESGFSSSAHSHSNAVGYWQFIRSTGKHYGLMVDPFIDERRDAVLSTRAAAEYFRALYNLFGSWHLALAAYNVGENRVKRAVMKYHTRDYWELIKHRRSLPAETKHYVPKMIAATIIARDPEKFGFTNIQYSAPLAFDAVQLVNPISMSKLAQNLNMDVDDFKELNPKFRGDFIPQYRGAETFIRVPVGKAIIVQAAIPSAISVQPKVVSSDFYFYRVRNGDSLSVIAQRHRTSINNLRRLNDLGSRSFLRAGQKLRVPDRGGAFVTYEMPKPSPGPSMKDSDENTEVNSASEERSIAQDGDEAVDQVHVVRRGDTLGAIARKYKLSLDDLRRFNKLKSRSVLRLGQTLLLKERAEPEAEQPESSKAGTTQNSEGQWRRGRSKTISMVANAKNFKAKKIKAQRHRVRRGETLAAIAQNYRVSVGQIARRNSISNHSRLLAGVELIIPKGSFSRRGD